MSKEYIRARLYSLGVGATYLRFFDAFLAPRFGVVCVQGHFSTPFPLEDMVFQGTVLGPPDYTLLI